MGKLNDLLHELGISKVKLAKFLGVSRQMIYNYLELDDLNKWPKDKKVLLLNLLGIKSPDDLKNIKIDTDYILDVETRLNSLIENSQEKKVTINGEKQVFNHLGKKQKDLLINIVDLIIPACEVRWSVPDQPPDQCVHSPRISACQSLITA